MDYARYLMLDPRSYELEHQQLFDIHECQFCSSTSFNYQKLIPAGNYSKQGIAWIQRCQKCKRTISAVKKHPLHK